MMAIQDYRWGAGHNAELAALVNVETDLYPYTRPRRTAVQSQPIDPYPVETRLASGAVRGDGFITQQWQMVMTQEALAYALAKFGLTGAKSATVTIYTREHDLGTYGRYNAYLVRPSTQSNTLEYVRQGILRVTWRFMRLVRL